MFNKTDFRLELDDNYCQKRREYVASRTVRYGDDGLPIKEDRHVYTLYDDTFWIEGELKKYLTLELPKQRYKKIAKPMPPSVDLVMANKAWWMYHEFGRHYLCDST